MECACIDADVDDFSTVLSDKIIVARSAHKCGECNREIMPGEKYRLEKMLYAGHFDHAKTCLDCSSIRKELVCSFYWGQVLELVKGGIDSADGEISESSIAALTPRAREMVCEMIELYWERYDETT